MGVFVTLSCSIIIIWYTVVVMKRLISKTKMSELLTFVEAKEFLRTTTSTLYRLIENGIVPASKVGGQWRFKKERLEDWLSQQEIRFKEKMENKKKPKEEV